MVHPLAPGSIQSAQRTIEVESGSGKLKLVVGAARPARAISPEKMCVQSLILPPLPTWPSIRKSIWQPAARS